MNVTMMRMKPLVVELRKLNRLIELWLESQGIAVAPSDGKREDEVLYTNDEQSIIGQLREAGMDARGDLAAKIRHLQSREWDTND